MLQQYIINNNNKTEVSKICLREQLKNKLTSFLIYGMIRRDKIIIKGVSIIKYF